MIVRYKDRPEVERRRTARSAAYEWVMLDRAYRSYRGSDSKNVASLELFLLHARALRDFFDPCQPDHEDDVRAYDFVGGRVAWRNATKDLSRRWLDDRDTRDMINTLLAHLSWRRAKDEVAVWEWNEPVASLYKELSAQWQSFQNNLEEPEVTWFKNGEAAERERVGLPEA
jgi:hypothetical protein